MLHEFVVSNREELIGRCRAAVTCRAAPATPPSMLEQGIPEFLTQLVDALRRTQADASDQVFAASTLAAATERLRSAAVHGKELQENGYTVDQVVHVFGDICQAITGLAREEGAPVTIEEFQTLNGLLDGAIADAVAAFEGNRDQAYRADGQLDLHQRLGALADEERRLVNTALKAFEAIRNGTVGPAGATGNLLEDSLLKLRELIDRSLPELRLGTGMTRGPAPPA